jgi:hypothetical protein
MRGGCGEPFRGPQAVVTHPAAIGVQHDVRIVRTLEPCLLWPNRYRIGASQRTVVKGQLRKSSRGIAECYFCFANGLATSRAPSMKSCATGLSMRFFNVRIPIGPLVTGNSTRNLLIDGCLAGYLSTDC